MRKWVGFKKYNGYDRFNRRKYESYGGFDKLSHRGYRDISIALRATE